MSYTSQRLMNKFPYWSAMQSDPSSQGHRFFACVGDILEDAEFENLRIGKLNEVLISGAPLFDLSMLYVVNLRVMQDLDGNFIDTDKPDGSFNYPLDYEFFLNEDDEEPSYDGSGAAMSIFGLRDLDEFFFKEEYLLKELLIWSSDDGDLLKDGKWFQEDDFINPDYNRSYILSVEVSNSEEYKKWGDDGLPYGGYHRLILRGINDVGARVQESIYIHDDGVFYSKNRFVALQGFNHLPAVEYDGFDGDVNISLEAVGIEEKVCPFMLGVSAEGTTGYVDDTNSGISTYWPNLDFIKKRSYRENINALNHEGPLLVKLSEDEEGNGFSYIDTYFHIFSNGQRYRRVEVDDHDEDDIKQLLCSQILLDGNGKPYTAVDFAFNWWDGLTYVLDVNGIIHKHKLSPRPFKPWTFQRTKSVDIDIQPLTRRAVYGEEIPLWTWHKVLRAPIEEVIIYRESPLQAEETQIAVESGVSGEPMFRGEYLHYDPATREYSWKPERNTFKSENDEADLPERSWVDKKFYSDFPLDFDEDGVPIGLGQWNFYCETKLKGRKSLSLRGIDVQLSRGFITQDEHFLLKEEILRQEDEDLIRRSSTAVMVEYNKETGSLGSLSNPFIENSVGLWFDGFDNILNVVGTIEGSDSFKVKRYSMGNSSFLVDPINALIVMTKPFGKVKFTLEVPNMDGDIELLRYTVANDNLVVEKVEE